MHRYAVRRLIFAGVFAAAVGAATATGLPVVVVVVGAWAAVTVLTRKGVLG